MRQFYEAWQPYLKTNDEFFLENKSIAVATDLEQTDEVALVISEKR